MEQISQAAGGRVDRQLLKRVAGNVRSVVALIVPLIFLTACAARAPVFYANEHYNTVGEAQAERDVAECQRLADENVSSSAAANVAGQAAIGGGAGAAIGAAGGAASGRAGSGAAAGAASGAVAGLLRGIFHARGPDALHRSYTEACLRERGYKLVGWK